MTHLTPDQLGDVDAVAGHEHLRTCDRCRAQWHEQREVRDLLRTLPDPGPMPADVAAGLGSALAGLRREGAEAVGPTVVPLRPAAGAGGLTRRARPWLAAAAAVVVLGGAGAALVTHPLGGSDQNATSSAGTPQPAQEGASGDASSVAGQVVSTGTEYERAQLPAQVRRDLLSLAAPTGDGSEPAPPRALDGSAAAGDTRLTSPAALASCLSALGLDADQLSTVDLARFDGQPAAVLVLRGSTGGYDVWVVGRGCRHGDDQTRYFVRLP